MIIFKVCLREVSKTGSKMLFLVHLELISYLSLKRSLRCKKVDLTLQCRVLGSAALFCVANFVKYFMRLHRAWISGVIYIIEFTSYAATR